ncbi:MAG: iron-containing alcohol dehydrogenase, partial [Halioglobus sp.]|nr:iron-containing alcohol dehydrogenase [Halioglobus sp.]
ARSLPIGGLYNTHRGTTSAVVMPAVVAFNGPAIEEDIRRLASYLDIAGEFDGFLEFLVALNRSLNIPENLTALGVVNPDLDALVAATLADPCAGTNPVTLTPVNTRALLEQCLGRS